MTRASSYDQNLRRRAASAVRSAETISIEMIGA